MDGFTSSDFLNKDEIKAALPLEYVLVHYGVVPRGNKALCPFHDDHDPSLELWQSDDGAVRFKCFPCGAGGDVFDFIQQFEGVGFHESIRRAGEILDELPDMWEPRMAAAPPGDTGGADFAQIATEALARNSERPGWLSVSTRLLPRATDDEAYERTHALDRWIASEWRWGMDERARVVMPHWHPEGRIVGIKIRASDGRRESAPGSRYLECLYGAWRPRRSGEVFLAEGETDAVWADWQMRGEGMNVHVLALPGGASAAPNANYIENLRGARRIYLCFDADAAGIEATFRWLEALRGDNLFQDVRVCQLPWGMDLRDTRPRMSVLLENAVRPDMGRWLIEDERRDEYIGVRMKNGEPQRYIMARWRFRPQSTLSAGDPEEDAMTALRGTLHVRGNVKPDIITVDDFSSAKNLNKWGGDSDRRVTWEGSDADVQQRLRPHLLDKGAVLPEEFATGRVGLHEPPPKYAYLGRSLVYPEADADTRVGKIPWRYVERQRIANLTGRTTFRRGEVDYQWVEQFLALNEPEITHPLLAWLAASTRRTELRDFPLLFLGGSSGAGKSTLARIALDLFGSGVETSLAQATGFVLLSHLSSTTTVPVFVDEWTRKSRTEAREAFQSNMPMIYEGGLAARGTQDQTLVYYRMTSPVLVAGEDTFQLTREKERTLILEMKRDAQRPDALRRLAGVPLGSFGYWFYSWLIEQPLDALPPFPDFSASRPEYNVGVIETGWHTLRTFLFDAETGVELPAAPDLSGLERAAEETNASENTYDVAIQQAIGRTDESGNPLAWEDDEGRGVWIRPEPLIGRLGRELDLPGGAQAMLRYLRETHPISQHRIAPHGMQRLRAWLIEGYELPS